MFLPPDHPLRRELNDEVHARPPEALRAPLRISYVALLSDPANREAENRALAALAEEAGLPPPGPRASHFSADFGGFRLKWERHTEFSRFMVAVTGPESRPFAEPALRAVPETWLSGLSGALIAAAEVVLLPGRAGPPDLDDISRRCFAGNTLVGAVVAGGKAVALTDMRIDPDGCTRFYVEDHGLADRQAGRTVQRLLEIETYKTMALLALPVARSLAPALGEAERELAGIAAALANARAADEPVMLDRLTRLEAETESRISQTQFRFSAAFAYDDLVRRRIRELRETRIEGLQTFEEFVERRLTPAMNTCRAASARQEALSDRAARATQLLSTRVEVTRSEQSGELLRSMDRRARLQLRLQETVEGLSVAAVTYYIVGLVGYAAKGLHTASAGIDPETVVAASIPFVLLLTALGVRRIRRSVSHA